MKYKKRSINWKNPEEVKQYKKVIWNEWSNKNDYKKRVNERYKHDINYQISRKNHSKKQQKSGYFKVRRDIIKKTVLQHYSNSDIPYCKCCNEIDIKTLVIDHIIGGNGIKQRSSFKSRSSNHFHNWLIKNNFPKGFQVLCVNCNFSKGTKDKCIHQRKIQINSLQLNSSQKYRIKLKTTVMIHYSQSFEPYCKCCGENEIEMLTIDHINGEGNKHRKEVGIQGGYNFYKWLIDNNYPLNFQVLCMKCNFLKHFYDIKAYDKYKELSLVNLYK